ncbi:MAG TPA: fumarylacetoacetate hydrolase family protein [Steroidobacteraceae bacterium]|nr:fumarylacetoacetate hydrolase family protein [Steroidobacteraceae bacterium]
MASSTASAPFSLATFSIPGGAPAAGLVAGDRVLKLAAAPGLTGADSMLGLLEYWDRNFPALQGLATAVAAGDAGLPATPVALSAVRLHAPVPAPRQIFCSGANYKKHVAQIIVAQTMSETAHMSQQERWEFGVKKMDERARSGTPYFFLKGQSTVTGPFDPVVLPHDVTQPDWELELGVVIGRPARRVSRGNALDHVAGYVVVNDVTTRERVNRKEGDLKEMGMNWVASKSSPTFLPMGPYLVPAAFVPDPQQLQIVLKLNGETMQNESTADMIFGVARLIEYASEACLLQPGDVICTGSPAGNGVHYKRFLKPGDVLEGSITGLGTQRNACVAEPR